MLRILDWFLRILAAVILLQTLFFKFTGAPESVYIFTTLGAEPWGRYGSGIAELIASVLLLVPRTVWIGASMGIGLMAGAILSHLTRLGIEVQGDGGLLFALAVVTFVACVASLVIHRREIPWIGKRPGSLVLAWLVLCPALSPNARAQEADGVYTEISEEACTALPETEGGGTGLRCPGVAGYELLAYDEDARANLAVVSPDGKVHDLDFWNVVTRYFSALGPRVEWRMSGDGDDEAASFLVRLDAYEDPKDPEKVTPYRVVVKLAGDPICAVYRVSPGSDQEALARELADEAEGSPCLLPRLHPDEIEERIAWLRDNSIPISTLQPDADPSDLRPLMEAIGTARVVQLGEANHGDGATLLAKTRLIRFLHEEMGFDVLAWESGFFDCREMDAGMRGSEPVADVASRCLYSTWWKSAEVEPFLEYVRGTWQTPRPLRIVGFDSRVSTEAGRKERLPRFVFDFFDRLDPALISAEERADLTTMSVGLVPADYYYNPGPRHYNRELPRRLVAVIDERGDELRRLYSPAEIAWARQALLSLMNMDRALEAGQGRGAAPDGFSRDTAMGENLVWWLRGPLAGEKVVVWAHNYHVQEGLPGGRDFPSQPFLGPAGHHVAKALGEEVYTLGFLSYSGAHGYPGQEPEALPGAAPDTMDSMLHATGYPVLFLDLLHRGADHWVRGSWYAGFNFYNSFENVWASQYDAIFFIDVQRPATLISALRSAGDTPADRR